jgi:hypothetical protein
VASERDLDHLVTTGEAAISREHTMWMAKLGRPRSGRSRGEDTGATSANR